jgi:hypothetical protein
MWTSDAPDREGPEQSFLNEVRTFHVVPAFRTIADLKAQVRERIRAIAAEDLAPWCKLGRIVFRATEIEDHGDIVTVTARVRDDAVALALEEARGDQWNRGRTLRFTWSGRSRYVDVSKVLVTTTSARSKVIRLELKSTNGPQDSSFQYSMDGLTPDDLIEKALRTVLFGEPNPLARSHLAFSAEIDDPLQPLRVSSVSEEILRPLAELLLTDLLIGMGRVGRIVELKIGVQIRGHRPFLLSWETPRRYANDTVAVRNIRGEINL